MPNFKIFTESNADVRFLKQFIQEIFGGDAPKEDVFDTLGGNAGYKPGGLLKASIQQNHDNGKQIILILDADNDFAQRHADVISDFQGYKIPVHLFLFPNNNQNGCLENLLCEIAVEQNILRCFEGYEDCIVDYQSPHVKSKIFAYLDALLRPMNKKNNKDDLIQPPNRNYRNTEHWNLHHDYLNPLHNFLTPFFNS